MTNSYVEAAGLAPDHCMPSIRSHHVCIKGKNLEKIFCCLMNTEILGNVQGHRCPYLFGRQSFSDKKLLEKKTSPCGLEVNIARAVCCIHLSNSI